MADQDQNLGGQNVGQNPDQQKQPERPANAQKNAFKRRRFRYAKNVKKEQTKEEVKQKMEAIKPQNVKGDNTQNTNKDNVNRNKNRDKWVRGGQRPKKPGEGDGRGGLIGRMVNKTQPVKPQGEFLKPRIEQKPKEPVKQKIEQRPQEQVKPKIEQKPQDSAKPLNPFLVDFESKKKPIGQPKITELKKPEVPKQEPKKAELPKQEPQKPQEESIKPANPFIIEPKEKVEKIPSVKKEDLEPADEGDEDLDNEIIPRAQPQGPQTQKPQPQRSPSVNPFVQPEKKPDVFVGEVVEKPQNPFEQKSPATKPQTKEVDEKLVDKEGTVEGGKMKQNIPQASSPGFSPGKSSQDNALEQEETVTGVLKNIGITKKRIIYFCGSVVVIAVLIVAGIFVLNFLKGENKVPRGGEQAQEIGGNSGVISSYLLGVQFSKNANILNYSNYSGALLALELGGVSYIGGQYADYMEVLRQMQNIYDTNIYDLIDRSTDRRALLEAHLTQMKELIAKGEAIYYEVVDRMDRLNSQYEELAALQTQDDTAFFGALRALQSESSSDYMNSFVDVSQKMVQVKAYFGAYKVFKAMFANSVNALRPRYQDILLNKEAIIQGIYVFDVPGSDIGAIIRLDTISSE